MYLLLFRFILKYDSYIEANFPKIINYIEKKYIY